MPPRMMRIAKIPIGPNPRSRAANLSLARAEERASGRCERRNNPAIIPFFNANHASEHGFERREKLDFSTISAQPSTFLRRILFKFWQLRIHLVPWLRV